MSDRTHPQGTAPARDVTTTARRGPVVAAWLAPAMVAGGFALFSAIPTAVVLVRTLRQPRLRPLRPLAVAPAGVYVLAVTLWLARPDRADSLSKSLHPLTFTALVVAGVAYAVALHVHNHRTRTSTGTGPVRPEQQDER